MTDAGGRTRRPLLEHVEWTIDDMPAPVSEWQTNERVNWGYDRMSGRVPTSWGDIAQGMPVTGYTSDGEVIYYGRVIAPPKRIRGIAYLEAVGEAVRAAKSGGGELVQSQDLNDWKMEAGAGGGAMRPEVAHGVMLFAMAKGTSIAASSEEGLIFIAENNYVTRVAFSPNNAGTAGDFANIKLRVYAGTSASMAQVGADLSTTVTTDQEFNISTGGDRVAIRLRNTGGATVTPATNNFYWLENVRVNGNYVGDVIPTSDVISQVGTRLQYNTTDSITPGVVPANPLYFHGPNDALFSFLANWDLYRWLVLENRRGLGPVLEYGPYGPTFTGYLSDGVLEDLDPLEIFNVARVQYTLQDKELQTRYIEADPDPLASTGVRNEIGISLPELQMDEGTALTLGTRALEYYGTQRVRGTVPLGSVVDENGALVSPRHVRAGCLLNIADYDPVIPPQRIVGITQNANSVTADITELDPLIGRQGRAALGINTGDWTRIAGVTHRHLVGDVLPPWLTPDMIEPGVAAVVGPGGESYINPYGHGENRGPDPPYSNDPWFQGGTNR